MMDMPKIINCSEMDCAYNQNQKCHAIAITVGSSEAMCDTFIAMSKKGGIPDMIGGVGACKMDDCAFNQSLECTATGINITPHAGHADCSTFKAR